jgi:multidrug efflux pump subunit AcrB
MEDNKMRKEIYIGITVVIIMLAIFLGIKFFSEEEQNIFMRKITTTIGYKEGEVRVFAGQQHPVFVVKNVEKLTTAFSSTGKEDRPYRFGFGYIDEDLDGKISEKEKKKGKKYFEIGPFTQYIYLDASN